MTTLRWATATVVLAIIGALGLTTPATAAPAGPGRQVEAGSIAGPTSVEPDARGRYNWGAIALSGDNYAVTISYRPTKARARKTVLRECRRISAYPGTCTWRALFANQCAAISVTLDSRGFVTGTETAYGRTQAIAKRKAVRKLPGSRYRAGVCTPR